MVVIGSLHIKITILAILLAVTTLIWVFKTDEINDFDMRQKSSHHAKDKLNTTDVRIHPKFTYDMPHYEEQFKNPCFHTTDKSMKCFAYAFLLGMPKCGTTDLFKKLRMHPEIAKTEKGNHWWTRGRFTYTREKKYPVSLMTYSKHFAKDTQDIIEHPSHICVDGSASTLWDMDYWSKHVDYSQNPGAEPQVITAHYIQQVLPNARFIVILRNPTERLYSGYHFFRKKGQTSQSDFHKSVLHDLELLTACVDNYGARSCVYNAGLKQQLQTRLSLGMYHIYLEDWLKVFPRDRFFILRLEDYRGDRNNILQKLCEFLNIGKFPEPLLQVIDESRNENIRLKGHLLQGDMLEQTRAKLSKFYQPYNEKLADMLSDDRYRWL